MRAGASAEQPELWIRGGCKTPCYLMRQHGSGRGGLSLNWWTWVGSYISRTRGSDANGLEYVDDTTEVESSGDESIRVASPKIGGRHVFSEVVGDPPSAGSGGNKSTVASASRCLRITDCS